MKTLYFECNMGAAGDMLMAGLYEICSEKELFLNTMNAVFAPFGVQISAEPAIKCGIAGTHITVKVHGEEEGKTAHHSHNDTAEATHTQDSQPPKSPDDAPSVHKEDSRHPLITHHRHTDYPSILSEIDLLTLPNSVKKDISAIYQIIGKAEAAVHHTTLEQIHFHEVGTLDALADVAGCALLISMIAPEQILSSPIHAGNGFVHCAHGVLPVPAPATAEILKGIPYYTGGIASELCTPTGAAILKYYVTRFFSMPPMAPEAIGYGMGTKDFEIANCVRIFFGETFTETQPNWKDVSALTSDYRENSSVKEDTPDMENDFDDDGFPYDDSVLAISCNIDDMTGEALGLATEIFMAAGALDVYTIPVQMKKNRPGILITCICAPEERDRFTGLFFLHTSTRGVRYQIYERAKLESTFETRPTAYGNIRIKKSAGYGIEKEKPEFEDLKSVVLKNECQLSLEDVAKSIRS